MPPAYLWVIRNSNGKLYSIPSPFSVSVLTSLHFSHRLVFSGFLVISSSINKKQNVVNVKNDYYKH